MEWTAAATRRSTTAAHAGTQPIEPNNTAAPAKIHPDRTVARTPLATVSTPRLMRTCNAATRTVLITNTAPTVQRGACPSLAIHSGAANSSTSNCMLITPISAAEARNRRSPNAIHLLAPCGTGSGSIGGTRKAMTEDTTNVRALNPISPTYQARVSKTRPSPPATPPNAIPTLVTERRYARNTAFSSPPNRAIIAPRAARLLEATRFSTTATPRNCQKVCTMVKATITAPASIPSTTLTSRGPRRSAKCPTGTPAASPNSPAMVRPSPTCEAGRPTDRVKYMTMTVMYMPLPIVFTNVATAMVLWTRSVAANSKHPPQRRSPQRLDRPTLSS